ncbi:hypothetical protein P8791_00650 [Bacillus subtilis]|nr:hypothetical protein [Bacillus subtilis]MEC0319906.1 hypothetical protein [Bacillus subtilis]
MSEKEQLETLKKNIWGLSLAFDMLRSSEFSDGVYFAIDEILKNSGLTIESLLKESRVKESEL